MHNRYFLCGDPEADRLDEERSDNKIARPTEHFQYRGIPPYAKIIAIVMGETVVPPKHCIEPMQDGESYAIWFERQIANLANFYFEDDDINDAKASLRHLSKEPEIRSKNVLSAAKESAKELHDINILLTEIQRLNDEVNIDALASAVALVDVGLTSKREIPIFCELMGFLNISECNQPVQDVIERAIEKGNLLCEQVRFEQSLDGIKDNRGRKRVRAKIRDAVADIYYADGWAIKEASMEFGCNALGSQELN